MSLSLSVRSDIFVFILVMLWGPQTLLELSGKWQSRGKFMEVESGCPEDLAEYSIRVTSDVTWIHAIRSLSI